MKIIKISLFLALLNAPNLLFAVDDFYTVSLSASRDSNFALATNADLAKTDSLLELYADYGIVQNVGEGKNLSYTASLTSTKYYKYPEWDSNAIAAELVYWQKLGLGDHAPSVNIRGSIGSANFASDVRDSWNYALSVGLKKRLSDRWEFQGSINYRQESADEASGVHVVPAINMNPSREIGLDVYDIENTSLNLSTEYALSENNYLSLNYLYREGDVASLGRDSESVAQYAEAAVFDLTFVGKKDDFDDLFVYRIDSKTHGLNLAFDYVLSERSSVQLAFDYQLTKGRASLDYERKILSLSYVYGN